VEEPRTLPDLPSNAALLDYLRRQASPASSADDGYSLGPWQLHTHPDLVARLGELAHGWPLSAAYGVPLLASDGVVAVVALGTSWLAVRIAQLPAGVESGAPDAAWSFVTDNWHIVNAWQGQLAAVDGTRLLRKLLASALAYAGR